MRYEWRPYVPVASRRASAAREMRARQKRGETVEPVAITGRTIARTFWGRAWCEHLEGFGDYSNRLPRGRTYVRNGSVCHLGIAQGKVQALVMGSELYEVRVSVNKLPKARWQALKKRCAAGIGSLLELLEGRLSESVMSVVTDPAQGLFPLTKEIRYECSCPDWASMCKHVSATFYAVGARLDERPELLFALRGVNHEELISADASAIVATDPNRRGGRRRVVDSDLADVFDIEITGRGAAAGKAPAKRSRRAPAKEPAPVPAKRNRRAPAASRSVVRAPRSFTGAAVVRLRASLGMSRSQLASLLQVSAASIGNWETTKGRLNLQQRTLEALQSTAVLTPKQAWRRLKSR